MLTGYRKKQDNCIGWVVTVILCLAVIFYAMSAWGEEFVPSPACASKEIAELKEHEKQTHNILGKIIGTDSSLEDKATQLVREISRLREALYT